MRFRPLGFLVALVLSGTAALAAPLTRDLGQGLTYYRVHMLPADLPSPPAKPAPLVLDLRYVTCDRGGVDALEVWLKFRALPAAPVFILANADTTRGLRQVLAGNHANPAVVTLGPASEGFTPDIGVDISAGEERRAYEALEKGQTVEALTVENADKPRRDEAEIAKDRAHGSSSAGDPEADDPDTVDDSTKNPSPTTADNAAPPAPPVDRDLQRAIQLHRALLALKRI
jgi:hypothetical protein